MLGGLDTNMAANSERSRPSGTPRLPTTAQRHQSSGQTILSKLRVSGHNNAFESA
jgi:hypothetical protein